MPAWRTAEGLRRAKGEVAADAAVRRGERVGGVGRLEASGETREAPMVAVAAGAWSDQVAACCGVALVGLVPKRRSAAVLAPAGTSVADCRDLAGRRQLLCRRWGVPMLSPADEDPVEPHDAWADDLRLAEAAGLERCVIREVQRFERTWGGLRTFAPDGLPLSG
jgi:D-arginine dehydrogenase